MTLPAAAAAATLPPPPAVRVQLLRTPQLLIDDVGARPLNAADAALLALLAFDGPTTRARVVALLCPDLDPPAARNLLRQRLFRLRRAAGIELVTSGELLALADGIVHDLGDPAPALVGDAAALIGEVLGDQAHDDLPAFADWLVSARARWRAQRRDALARIAARLEAEHHIAAALAYAERLVGDEPLFEHAQRQLMRLHYRRGDRSAALAVHARFRAALGAQLGVAPADETQALVALIERSAALPGTSATALPGTSAAALPGTSAAALPATRAVAPRPAALMRPPQRIGRDAEWQAIAAACQHRRAVLISGEAGIGKSRLLSDAAMANGYALVAARPGDARLPYAVLGRLLRSLVERGDSAALAPWARAELARLVPELAAPPPGAIDAGRLQRATEEALALIAPAGLAIDDLQFADAASIELLLALASADSVGLGVGPCWMFAIRADAASPAVEAWLQAAPGGRAGLQLRLAPLTLAAVEQLLASLALPEFDAPRWAARVHRHAGGNPMFILETLAALRIAAGDGSPVLRDVERLPVPDSLRLLIEGRLQQLSPHALKLARVAALAGQDFDVELAAKVLAQHPLDLLDAWAELEAAQIVDARAFVHDLVLEATQRSVPQPIALWLHRAIAQALAAVGRAPAARVAPHWFAAGAWAEAAEAYLRAARQTFDASRLNEAAALFESAADAYDRAGQPAEQHRALQELIGCHTKRHQLGEAKRLAVRLRALARDVEQEAWALDRLGDIANMGRDDAEAEAAVRAMLVLADRSENRWIAFNATRKLAVVLAHRGRSDESLALFRSQQDWIAAHPADWNVHVWFSDAAYVLELADRRRDAIAAADAVLAQARTHENWYVVYAATRNRALARHGQGDLQGALLDADAAWRLNDRLGDDAVQRNPREAARRAMLLRDDGQHAEAIALLEQSVACLAVADSPFWRAFCEDQLALSYLAVGQLARARALVFAEGVDGNVEARAMRAFVRMRWRQASGDGPAGVDANDPGEEARTIAADPACPRRWRSLIGLEACGLEMHRPGGEDACAACIAIAREATAHEMPGIALHARLRAARAAIAASDRRRAKADVQAALAAWRHNAVHPTGLSLPQFLWWAAEVHQALGNLAEAQRLLHLALRQLREVELAQVPEPFRDSFLHRHPVHRSLLAAATRWATA